MSLSTVSKPLVVFTSVPIRFSRPMCRVAWFAVKVTVHPQVTDSRPCVGKVIPAKNIYPLVTSLPIIQLDVNVLFKTEKSLLSLAAKLSRTDLFRGWHTSVGCPGIADRSLPQILRKSLKLNRKLHLQNTKVEQFSVPGSGAHYHKLDQTNPPFEI